MFSKEHEKAFFEGQADGFPDNFTDLHQPISMDSGPELREMPMGNPDLMRYMARETAQPDGTDPQCPLPKEALAGMLQNDPNANIPMASTSATHFSDSVAIGQVLGTASMSNPQAAAGVASSNRNYKMASDIFGTGLDRPWNEAENNGNEPQPMSALTPPNRHRTEPSSFKITEMASTDNSTYNVDTTNSSPARKARESSGNPLTGQGYNASNTRTAKRYYEGSNNNQKLW